MFPQVFVYKCDQDDFKFFWYPNDDLNQLIQDSMDYRMQTHVFGAKSSPCCAGYALRVTVMSNQTNADDHVIKTVFRKIHLDDVCCTCKSANADISLISKLFSLLESSGFHLTKFLSNNVAVLSCSTKRTRSRSGSQKLFVLFQRNSSRIQELSA